MPPTVWTISEVQQMSEQAGKLKKLQGTIQEPFHACLLCTGPLSPLAHLILQGVEGLDFIFFYFTDEETD